MFFFWYFWFGGSKSTQNKHLNFAVLNSLKKKFQKIFSAEFIGKNFETFLQSISLKTISRFFSQNLKLKQKKQMFFCQKQNKMVTWRGVGRNPKHFFQGKSNDITFCWVLTGYFMIFYVIFSNLKKTFGLELNYFWK